MKRKCSNTVQVLLNQILLVTFQHCLFVLIDQFLWCTTRGGALEGITTGADPVAHVKSAPAQKTTRWPGQLE